MEHQIAEAIIENGKITYVDKQLPYKIMKVHLIYDIEDSNNELDIMQIIRQTSGLYKDIDVADEAKKLRSSWERKIND